MSNGEVLAQVLARAAFRMDQQGFISLPMSLPPTCIDHLVQFANAFAGIDPTVTRELYAVRVVPAGPKIPDLPSISSNELLVYRGVEKRLFAWREGEYDRIASASPIGTFLDHTFPADRDCAFGFNTLAQSFGDVIQDTYEISGDELVELKAALEYVLVFLAEIMERTAATELPWTAAWWSRVMQLFDDLYQELASVQTELGLMVFACAGLPKPLGSNGRYKKLKSKDYLGVFSTYWQDPADALNTVGWLHAISSAKGSDPLPLAHLDWEKYPDHIRLSRSALVAFTELNAKAGLGSRVEIWAATDENQFRMRPAGGNELLTVSYDGKVLPSLKEIPGTYMLPFQAVQVTGLKKDWCHYENVSIVVPWADGIDWKSVKLQVAPDFRFSRAKNVRFIPAEFKVTPEGLLVHGTLEVKATILESGKPITITARRAHGQEGLLVDAKAQLVVAGSSGVTILCACKQANKRPKLFVSYARLEERDGTLEPVLLTVEKPLTTEFMLAVGSNATTSNFGSGNQRSSPHHDWDCIAQFDSLPVQDGTKVYLLNQQGETADVIRVQIEDATTGAWSSLEAAARGTMTLVNYTELMRSSVQGRLEENWSHSFADETGDLPLYYVLRTSLIRAEEIVGKRSSKHCVWLGTTPDEIQEAGIGPSNKLEDHPAFTRLLLSARELDKRLGRREDDSGEIVPVWPSSWQLRQLYLDGKEQLLEDYLAAYEELLDWAHAEGEPSDQFWVSYPFSAVVYDDIKQRVSCVFLSPLHPVRLAWRYAAERVFVECEVAGQQDSRLSQIVEGWNFPALGVAPALGQNSVMFALPIDPGPNQLFIGWSALVAPDDAQNLSLSLKAGGFRLPGGSGTGLNAGAVGAAIRDYTKIYPHLSCLGVELFSNRQAPRSIELDHAILGELVNIAGQLEDSRVLPTTVRVYDSSNRLGPPPSREEAFSGIDSFRKVDSFQFEWNTYKPGAQRPSVHVRFVEDSMAKLAMGQYDPAKGGCTGTWPLRRYVGRQQAANGKTVTLFHALSTADGWQLFERIVNRVETFDPLTQSVTVGSANIVNESDGKAKWVVTGNVYVDPSSVAVAVSNLAGGNSPRVLWEWRPPFLHQQQGDAKLNFARRPYITVAQVPQPLLTGIAKLEFVRQREKGEIEVLTELGKRGIGLASLLAFGDNHAEGALGFFLALRLLDRAKVVVENSASTLLVVPVDAIYEFLSAAGFSHDTGGKRADLLAIQVTRSEGGVHLDLVAVEIRCSRMRVGAQEFPSPESQQVMAKVAQAKETRNALCRLVEQFSQGKKPSNELKANAIALLVETALLTAPSAVDPLLGQEIIAVIVQQKATYAVKPGILFWFQNVPPEAETLLFEEPGAEAVAKLFLDPSCCAEEIWQGGTQEISKHVAAVFQSSFEACVITPHDGSDYTDDGIGAPQTEVNPSEAELSSDNRATASSPSVIEKTAPVQNTEQLSPALAGVEDKVASPEGVKIPVGRATGISGSDYAFWPSNTALNQLNIGILGDLGTGKTQLVKHLVYRLATCAESNRGIAPKFLVFDYKGDYNKPDFLDHVNGKVVAPHNIPLNFFSTENSSAAIPWLERFKFFEDVLSKIYAGIGPVQRQKLKEAVKSAYEEAGTGYPTIYEVTQQYEDQLNGKPDSPYAILSDMVDQEIFTRDPLAIVPFEEFLDGVVVIDLKALGGDMRTKNMLVAIFLNFFYEYMLRVPKRGFEGKNPQLRALDSFLLVDEADNIMGYKFDVLKQILLQGREFGTGVLLASQYLSHFSQSGVNYFEPLLTWFIHKVPNINANQLKALGIGSNEAESISERIKGLPVHHCFYKSLPAPKGAFMRGTPFFEVVGS